MVKTLTYNSANIQMLYDNLVNLKTQGVSQDFEIRVDDLIIIPRTSDLSKFFLFKKSLTEFSNEVVFILYKQKSRRNDKYILVRRRNVSHGPNMTQQEYIDSEIAKALKIRERELELTRLEEETKSQRQTIKELRVKVAELKAKSKGEIMELLQVLNQQFGNKSDSSQDDNQTINGIPRNEIVMMIAQARKNYGDEIFGEVLGIAMKTAENPQIIEEVKQFINLKIKANENEKK